MKKVALLLIGWMLFIFVAFFWVDNPKKDDGSLRISDLAVENNGKTFTFSFWCGGCRKINELTADVVVDFYTGKKKIDRFPKHVISLKELLSGRIEGTFSLDEDIPADSIKFFVRLKNKQGRKSNSLGMLMLPEPDGGEKIIIRSVVAGTPKKGPFII